MGKNKAKPPTNESEAQPDTQIDLSESTYRKHTGKRQALLSDYMLRSGKASQDNEDNHSCLLETGTAIAADLALGGPGSKTIFKAKTTLTGSGNFLRDGQPSTNLSPNWVLAGPESTVDTSDHPGQTRNNGIPLSDCPNLGQVGGMALHLFHDPKANVSPEIGERRVGKECRL